MEYVVRKDRIGCPEADNWQRVVVSTARHGIADNADLAAVLPVARSEAVADERNRAWTHHVVIRKNQEAEANTRECYPKRYYYCRRW